MSGTGAITVLMPVRNGMPHLVRAVSSTLSALPSTGRLHVLVDGGSDDSLSHLHGLRDSRLQVEHAEESVGVAAALNRLLQGAQSDYVARMDADDVCLPWRFTVQARSITDRDAVFSSAVYVDGRGRVQGLQPPVRLDEHALRLHLLLKNVLLHPTALMRRETVTAVGGYRATPAEDYDLWLRMLASGARIRRTALPGIRYRRHAHQVTVAAPWSRADPVLVQAYAALLTRAGGASLDARMLGSAAATGDFSGVPERDRSGLADLLLRSSAKLGPLQGRLLRSETRKRLGPRQREGTAVPAAGHS